MKYIGTADKDAPEDAKRIFLDIGISLARRGFTLRSDEDSLFVEGCKIANGDLGIPKIQTYPSDEVTVLAKETFEISGYRWSDLSNFKRGICAKNINLILGNNLDSPIDIFMHWTMGNNWKLNHLINAVEYLNSSDIKDCCITVLDLKKESNRRAIQHMMEEQINRELQNHALMYLKDFERSKI